MELSCIIVLFNMTAVVLFSYFNKLGFNLHWYCRGKINCQNLWYVCLWTWNKSFYWNSFTVITNQYTWHWHYTNSLYCGLIFYWNHSCNLSRWPCDIASRILTTIRIFVMLWLFLFMCVCVYNYKWQAMNLYYIILDMMFVSIVMYECDIII